VPVEAEEVNTTSKIRNTAAVISPTHTPLMRVRRTRPFASNPAAGEPSVGTGGLSSCLRPRNAYPPRPDLTRLLAGRHVDPSLSRVRVGDWAHKWLETKTNLKPTTRCDYESLLQAHVVPRWGSMTLAEVKHEDITS
jgi:Phage integrase, N-terminal SAM-like domain